MSIAHNVVTLNRSSTPLSLLNHHTVPIAVNLPAPTFSVKCIGVIFPPSFDMLFSNSLIIHQVKNKENHKREGGLDTRS